MVKLHEYQARDLMSKYGIPTTRGDVASSPAEVRAIAERLGVPVVVKAQVLVGGRGKAGGVRRANTPEDAEKAASAILGMNLKGITVERVLVAEAADVDRELYLGEVIDRQGKRVAMMASASGGMDIEEVARVSPEKIVRISVDPCGGYWDYQGRELAVGVDLPSKLVGEFARIARRLHRLFEECDASLAEINPLVITAGGTLLAIDSKVVVDDNALFRHPDLAAMRSAEEETSQERTAREKGFSYVRLDGTIGCMVNGAGLAMATMDVVKLHGGSPANFLDIGGGAKADTVEAALRIILEDKNVRGVFINIFGGITRCDEVAKGIVAALHSVGTELPMVIRLVGTNDEAGHAILREAGLTATSSMDEAALAIVRIVGSQQSH